MRSECGEKISLATFAKSATKRFEPRRHGEHGERLRKTVSRKDAETQRKDGTERKELNPRANRKTWVFLNMSGRFANSPLRSRNPFHCRIIILLTMSNRKRENIEISSS